jgi:RNA-directed DNA polymerase
MTRGDLPPYLVLTDLDNELERRGHSFIRYADDCNVYVQSRGSGARVLRSLTNFLEKSLKVRVNASKSAVDRPWKRKFLAYSMTFHKQGRLKVSPEAVKRFRTKVCILFRLGRGRNIKCFIMDDLNPLLRGWAAYLSLSGVKIVFDELDQWLRCKLHCLLRRQWKRPWTRYKKLCSAGLADPLVPETSRIFRRCLPMSLAFALPLP